MKLYDYLIVGSGLFGATFAHEMTKRGKKCIVLEKRKHIGGNIYTENKEGINMHTYGIHVFHTSNKEIWDYVNQFATFNNFTNRPKVNYKGKIYSFPINLSTLYQLWGVSTPEDAIKKLNESKVNIAEPANLEEWCLSQIGPELYETFIKGYTQKQWMMDPKLLPSFIIKRIPVRTTYDDNYYFDNYQGIPEGGYTQIIQKMLTNIPVYTNTDYLRQKTYWDSLATKVVYTGPIDEYFDYIEGELDYRTTKFEHETLPIKDYQGVAQVNFTDVEIPYTRIIEHKHFEFGKMDHTIITKEYPDVWSRSKIPYYPINDGKNNAIYKVYKERADKLTNVIFGGRLAEYRYYDMHQVIGAALHTVKKESVQ
jgi:UDP-galactopyranose mutase